MAERSRFSCISECTDEPGRSLPEIFPRSKSGISKLQIKKTFPEILYNEYGKWKYPSAEKVPETAKDDTHKNKTSSFDTGVLRKSLPGNRESFPTVKKEAGTIRNRRKR